MEKHEYPSNYGPLVHWATDATWEILDSIKPGLISTEIRALLAGQIAARLMAERAKGRGEEMMRRITGISGIRRGGTNSMDQEIVLKESENRVLVSLEHPSYGASLSPDEARFLAEMLVEAAARIDKAAVEQSEEVAAWPPAQERA